MENNKKGILLTESNVLDIYKKLIGGIELNQEELEEVLKRFNEIVEYDQH